MSNIIEFFSQNWVGVIGVVLAIFFYIKSRKVAKLAYQKSSIRLLGRDENNLPEEVTVHFQEKNVERLTKTTLILWNNGTEVLKGEQVVAKAPIKISFLPQDRILSCKILKRTNEHNDLSASIEKDNPHQLIIRFGYLNSKDGGVLELLHDSEERYPTIEGEIMGVPKGFEDLGQYGYGNLALYRIDLSNIEKITSLITHKAVVGSLWVMMILGIAMFLTAFSSSFIEEIPRPDFAGIDPGLFFQLVFLYGGLLYGILPAGLLWGRRRKYPKLLEIEK